MCSHSALIAGDNQAAGIRREEERIKRAKEEVERQKQEAFMREELKKLETLRLRARNWERASNLREYVAAAEKAKSAGTIVTGNVDFEDWKLWALSHADQIDPLTSGRAFKPEDANAYYKREEPEWDKREPGSFSYGNLYEESTHWTFKARYYRR